MKGVIRSSRAGGISPSGVVPSSVIPSVGFVGSHQRLSQVAARLPAASARLSSQESAKPAVASGRPARALAVVGSSISCNSTATGSSSSHHHHHHSHHYNKGPQAPQVCWAQGCRKDLHHHQQTYINNAWAFTIAYIRRARAFRLKRSSAPTVERSPSEFSAQEPR